MATSGAVPWASLLPRMVRYSSPTMDRIPSGTSPMPARNKWRKTSDTCGLIWAPEKSGAFLFSALALAPRCDIRIESSRATTRHAQRSPLCRLQMLRQKDNLAHVIAVVRDLPIDRLQDRVALAAD